MATFKISLERHKVRQGLRSQIKDTWRLRKVSKGVNKPKGRGAHCNHQGCGVRVCQLKMQLLASP